MLNWTVVNVQSQNSRKRQVNIVSVTQAFKRFGAPHTKGKNMHKGNVHRFINILVETRTLCVKRAPNTVLFNKNIVKTLGNVRTTCKYLIDNSRQERDFNRCINSNLIDSTHRRV